MVVSQGNAERPQAWVIGADARLREWIAGLLSEWWSVAEGAPGSLPAGAPPAVAVIHGTDLHVLDALPPEVPLVWIGPPPRVAAATRRRLQCLARQRLAPATLARAVREAVANDPPGRRDAARPSLPPRLFLPADLRVRLEGERGRPWPLLLVAEPGLETRRLVRWLHGGSAAGFVSVEAAEIADLLRVPVSDPPSTVFVEDLDGVPPAAQRTLAEALNAAGMVRLPAAAGCARLIASMASDPDAALACGWLDRGLYDVLASRAVHLPPLRERPAEIGPIATALLAEIAEATGRPVRLTDRAVERLASYPWPGNLSELRGVLVRSVAEAAGEVLDAEDLRIVAAAPPAGRGRASGPAGAGLQAVAPGEMRGLLEWVLNEIAHEVKNPLVTLQTLIRCVEEDEDPDRRELVKLARRSVARIDAALEGLLAHTRFGAPRPRVVPLRVLLAAAWENASRELEDRQVEVELAGTGNGEAARVDPHQAAWALGRILAALARRAPPGSRLRVETAAPATIRAGLESAAGGETDPLCGVLGDSDGAPEPLGVALARDVLARNGARLADDRNGAPWLRVSLPEAAPGEPVEDEEDGEDARPETTGAHRRRRNRSA